MLYQFFKKQTFTYYLRKISKHTYPSLQWCLRPLLFQTFQFLLWDTIVRNGKWLALNYDSYFIHSEVEWNLWLEGLSLGISYYLFESSTITMCWNWGITNIYSFIETSAEWLPNTSICGFFLNFVYFVYQRLSLHLMLPHVLIYFFL